MIMVFYATFNNMSALSWHSALMVEESGVPGIVIHNFSSDRYWLHS
jgi:hypothetical protein